MAVQLIEGFEGGSGWDNSFGSHSLITRTDTAGPWSLYAATGNLLSWTKQVKNIANASDVYLAFRFKTPQALDPLVQFLDASGSIMSKIALTGGLLFQIRDSSNVTKATGTTVVSTGVWHLVEIHFVVADGAGGSFDVRLDGLTTSECSASGYDTKPNTSNVNAVQIVASGLDDVIMYDATGAQWNTWVGDKGVLGCWPNAKGDVNQLLPDGKSAGITRWYFPRVDALSSQQPSGYFSTLQNLTPDALWDVRGTASGSFYRGELADQRRSSGGTTLQDHNNGMTDQTGVASSFTFANGDDVMFAQYVSPPLAAQTITGTFKCYVPISEAGAGNDARAQIVIRVVSNDGSVVRGVLYSGDATAIGPNPTSEFVAATVTNRGFPRIGLLPAAITNIGAITEGDRLVVELGWRANTGGTNQDFRFRFGDNGSSGDLPEDETTTSNLFNPWIEFSNGITLSKEGNFEYVNDGIAPNGLTNSGNEPFSAPLDRDSTYVNTSTDNERDLYNLTNVSPSYSVSGPIAIKSYQRKVDAGVRTLTHVYKTSGAEQSVGPYPLTTSWAFQDSLLDVDATDGAVWTDTKVNQLQIGPKATT